LRFFTIAALLFFTTLATTHTAMAQTPGNEWQITGNATDCYRYDYSGESAYRRMRGQVPFTFEEVSTLALEFEFSLDEIARKIGYIGISIISNGLANPEPSFCAILQEFSDYIGDR
jgi:hypothetical protein